MFIFSKVRTQQANSSPPTKSAMGILMLLATSLFWVSPAAADTQSIGSPLCSASGGSNRGALTFTFSNSSTSNDYYRITVGPHGHGSLRVGRDGTIFTLNGIPNGTHEVKVRNIYTGSSRTWRGINFNCGAPLDPRAGDAGTIAFSCDSEFNGRGRVRFTATNGSATHRDGYQFKVDSSNVGSRFGLGAGKSHPDTRYGIQDGTRILARVVRIIGNQEQTIKQRSHIFRCAPPVVEDTIAISTACMDGKARINFSARNNGTSTRTGYRFEFDGVRVGVPFSLNARSGHGDYTGGHNGFPAGVGDGTFTARVYRGSSLLRQRRVTITCAHDVKITNVEQRPVSALSGGFNGPPAMYGYHLNKDFFMVPGFPEYRVTACLDIHLINQPNKRAYDCRAVDGFEHTKPTGYSVDWQDRENYIVLLGNNKALDIAPEYSGPGFIGHGATISVDSQIFEGCIRGRALTPTLLSEPRPDLHVPSTAWHCDYRVRKQVIAPTSLGPLLTRGETIDWHIDYAECISGLVTLRKLKGVSAFLLRDCMAPGTPYGAGIDIFN